MQSQTLKQLVQLYGVHADTFKKWLAKVPELNWQPGTRIFTPKEVAIILEHLGNPSESLE